MTPYSRLKAILTHSLLPANNQLLTEQNLVLKEEIRKLERTLSRMDVAQNLEYLKNTFVTYVGLPSGTSEKQQLVPVLKTLLKLDHREETILQSDANDEPITPVASGGWTSILWGGN